MSSFKIFFGIFLFAILVEELWAKPHLSKRSDRKQEIKKSIRSLNNLNEEIRDSGFGGHQENSKSRRQVGYERGQSIFDLEFSSEDDSDDHDWVPQHDDGYYADSYEYHPDDDDDYYN